jgi:hypothetical protein
MFIQIMFLSTFGHFLPSVIFYLQSFLPSVILPSFIFYLQSFYILTLVFYLGHFLPSVILRSGIFYIQSFYLQSFYFQSFYVRSFYHRSFHVWSRFRGNTESTHLMLKKLTWNPIPGVAVPLNRALFQKLLQSCTVYREFFTSTDYQSVLGPMRRTLAKGRGGWSMKTLEVLNFMRLSTVPVLDSIQW